MKIMKYMKCYHGTTKYFDITKDEARSSLEGTYKPEFLDDIFENEKSFRLETPYSTIETRRDGATLKSGFLGVQD